MSSEATLRLRPKYCDGKIPGLLTLTVTKLLRVQGMCENLLKTVDAMQFFGEGASVVSNLLLLLLLKLEWLFYSSWHWKLGPQRSDAQLWVSLQCQTCALFQGRLCCQPHGVFALLCPLSWRSA